MSISVVIDSISGSEAVVKTEEGQEIRLPLSLLPAEAASGQTLYLNLSGRPSEASPQEILNELLNSDDQA